MIKISNLKIFLSYSANNNSLQKRTKDYGCMGVLFFIDKNGFALTRDTIVLFLLFFM